MSCELAVFDASAAPPARSAFLDWYKEAIATTATATAALATWRRQMSEAYPKGAILGGSAVVVASFSDADAEDAHTSGFALAGKHGLGFYDVGSGAVWLPDRAGQLVLAHRS
jgi:hypothetical protein